MNHSFLTILIGCQFGNYKTENSNKSPKNEPIGQVDPVDTAQADSGGVESPSDTGVSSSDSAVGDIDSASGDTDSADIDSGKESDTAVDDRVGTLVSDFELPDQNPHSPKYEDLISPRDYMGQVSGWYFIKAT